MIDLSLLAPPAIIDALGFETILAELKADAIARLPELAELADLLRARIGAGHGVAAGGRLP